MHSPLTHLCVSSMNQRQLRFAGERYTNRGLGTKATKNDFAKERKRVRRAWISHYKR